MQLSSILAMLKYDKYLGLTALVVKSWMREFQSIKDRVWKRQNVWKSKFLSEASKETLLKVVVQTIPTNNMSVTFGPYVHPTYHTYTLVFSRGRMQGDHRTYTCK